MRRTVPLLFRPSHWALYAKNPSIDLDHAPIIKIESGTFYRHHPSTSGASSHATKNPSLYPKLNFELPSRPLHRDEQDSDTPTKSQEKRSPVQQHWAVIGASGKTTFLEVLRGQHLCFPPTARTFPFLSSDFIEKKDHRLRFPGRAIQYVGFSGERGHGQSSGGTRGAYLSARYESRREETDWTVMQYLKGETELNPPEEKEGKDVHDDGLLEQVVSKLRLEKLVQMPVGNLSNGQTRRARIARALLGRPEVLLLDEPFMGLDPPTLMSLSPMLRDLAYHSSPRLIMSLRPQDPIPDWMTHLVLLGEDCTVDLAGPKHGVLTALRDRVYENLPPPAEDESPPLEVGQTLTPEGIVLAPEMRDPRISAATSNAGRQIFSFEAADDVPAGSEEPAPADSEPLVEMSGVVVRYGPKTVLGNWTQPGMSKPGLHWNIHRGSRWGLFGPNGSGKTTLLSLITSDHPQAYSLPVKHFGRSRLPQPGVPGISIFDIQSRIGHSSPEIHAFFPKTLSIRQTIENAWADTFLGKPRLTHARDEDVDAVLRWFAPELNPDHKMSEDGVDASDEESNELSPEQWRNETQLSSGRPALFTRTYPPQTAYRDDLEWADTARFGEVPFSSQRLLLLLRSFIHKPDLVILDEAFSGFAPETRDKAMLFLEFGERFFLPRTETEDRVEKRRRLRAGNTRTWKGKEVVKNVSQRQRLAGLSQDQAVVCISHVKEEVPSLVKDWLRLPGEEEEGVGVKIGRLEGGSGSLASEGWAKIWGMET